MRLVRLVVAAIALGAVVGFVGALLRPRTVHRSPGTGSPAENPATLPERDAPAAELPTTVEVRR
jgi:hypothetical protein